MVISFDGGNSWGSPFVINSNSNLQGDPDVVIDPFGRIHLFYHEAPKHNAYWGIRMLYGYSDDLGQTWHSPGVSDFDTISFSQRSYLAEGSRYDTENNVLWTFWKEEDLTARQGGDMVAAYSTDRGLTWTREYVTDRHDTTIGYKSAALLPDGGVCVNYELPNYPEASKFWVFYKERKPLTLGMPLFDNRKEMLIYPNPANDKLYIKGDFESSLRFNITNLLGESLQQGIVSNGSIDISNLPQGVYIFYLVQNRATIYTSKFVKK